MGWRIDEPIKTLKYVANQLQVMTLKHCNGCGEDKELNEFGVYKTTQRIGELFSHCKKCRSSALLVWRKNNPERAKELDRKSSYRYGSKPMSENRACSAYLGVVIAETILSHEFPGFVRMPYGNPNYDYDCPKGFKIDVKSSCRHHHKQGDDTWDFRIRVNKVANYFLFLAFGDRDKPLVPEHIWLIPGYVVNEKTGVCITDSSQVLAKWSKYERPLENTLNCCGQLRNEVGE